MTYKKILVFDFETSGLSAFKDEIIEIGAILFTKEGSDVERKELNVLVNSVSTLDPRITEITGITKEILEEKGITKEEAFQLLYRLYDEETLLVAYNIQFYLSFLIQLFRSSGLYQFEIKNDLLDVMAVHKDRNMYHHDPIDKTKSLGHRLDSAVKKYHVTIENTHRALDDVKATYEVLKAMKREKDNLELYVNKIGYNPKYGMQGPKLNHVTYIEQSPKGGQLEIEKMK